MYATACFRRSVDGVLPRRRCATCACAENVSVQNTIPLTSWPGVSRLSVAPPLLAEMAGTSLMRNRISAGRSVILPLHLREGVGGSGRTTAKQPSRITTKSDFVPRTPPPKRSTFWRRTAASARSRHEGMKRSVMAAAFATMTSEIADRGSDDLYRLGSFVSACLCGEPTSPRRPAPTPRRPPSPPPPATGAPACRSPSAGSR
jgi:hypothetical protein